jgi:hypothetical protein
MTAPGAQAHAGRLHHLDNLRTVLVAWVIGGHALLGYSAVGGWAYDEVNETTFAPATELVLLAVLGPSGLFVIGVFFFVAGLLTERAVDRHGPRRYTRERVVRLGLPWLVSAVLVWPASVWLAYAAAGRDVTFWWVLTHRDPLLDSGSLWFALVLLMALAAAGRLLALLPALAVGWARGAFAPARRGRGARRGRRGTSAGRSGLAGRSRRTPPRRRRAARGKRLPVPAVEAILVVAAVKSSTCTCAVVLIALSCRAARWRAGREPQTHGERRS